MSLGKKTILSFSRETHSNRQPRGLLEWQCLVLRPWNTKIKVIIFKRQQPREVQLASFFPLPLLEHCHTSLVAKAKTAVPCIFKIWKHFVYTENIAVHSFRELLQYGGAIVRPRLSSWRSPGQWCWILMKNLDKNDPKYFVRMVLVLIWWYSCCSATLVLYLGATIWKWEIAKINHFWHLCYVGFDFDKNASFIVRCNSVSVLCIFFTNSVSAAFSKEKPIYVLEWLNSNGFLINLPAEIRVGE